MPRKTSGNIEAKVEPDPPECQCLKVITQINLKNC